MNIENVRGGRGALLNMHELGGQRVATTALKASHDWTPVSMEFNSQRGGKMTINCLFGGWGQSKGTAWYDDIELIELGPGAAPRLPGLHPAVDRALQLVSKSYSSRGAVESVVAILSSLKDADPQLSATILDGLAAGWPKAVKPDLTSADKAELAALMRSLPQTHRDRLLALADRWGQQDIFSGDVAKAVATLSKQLRDTSATTHQRVDAAERLVRLADNSDIVDAILNQIDPQQPPPLVQGLIEAVATSRQETTGAKLAARFGRITPASRRAAISVLMRRPTWTVALLDAIEKGTIGVGDLSDQAWQTVTLHRDKQIASRAKSLAGKGRLP
ncbi:MAG: hypothetical protein MI757_01360, partial [Pirellulales bacterium]|nr:hypothetical protein [Pirellulales bacterium]